jgi:DNA-binding response OmpR family regulator
MLRRKSIPFLFLTTTSAQAVVLESYEMISQGFFTKPNSMEELKKVIQMILNYWKIAKHPNPLLI